MTSCEKTIGNRIYVKCTPEKCDDREYCTKRYHHVWYKKECKKCGSVIISPNPKIDYCSYTCRRSDLKDIRNT